MLTLVAGATEVTATVTAVDDTLDEDEETIRVTRPSTTVQRWARSSRSGSPTTTRCRRRYREVDPDVIGEADTGSSTVTVSTRDVTFATDQEIELSFRRFGTSGSTSRHGVTWRAICYTVSATS